LLFISCPGFPEFAALRPSCRAEGKSFAVSALSEQKYAEGALITDLLKMNLRMKDG
jgi:hypothetical protein